MNAMDGLSAEDAQRLHQHLRALADGDPTPALTLSMEVDGEQRPVTLPASGEAEALRQQLVEVTYALSHDLAEPTRTVNLFSQRLRERFRHAETSSDAQQWSFVLDAAQQSSTMLQELLRLSRAQRRPVNRGPVDADEVLETVLARLQPAIEARAALLTRSPLPQVLGCPDALATVLEEVLSNALRFSDRPPRVDIHALQEAGRVGVVIQDQGIGVAPRHQAAVFRPFRRLNHRDAYPGSGMGLTVAQVLTGRQGGQITLHGSDEGGTRVIVWLEESRT